MPSQDTKILEFNQDEKSDKAPLIIYGDLECLLEKIGGCQNNSENSSTTKLGEDIPSDFSMSTISSFKSIEKKNDVYRGKDCMKNFFESLREHTMEIINFKKKKMKLLTNQVQESYKMQKFEDKHAKDRNITKLVTIIIIQVNVEVLHKAYVI